MRTLITGGAGFIGSSLADGLLDAGHSVVVLDDFSTGREENLVCAKRSPLFKLYKVDISRGGELNDYFKGIDWVFHLAGLAEIVPSIKNPLAYHRVNVDGTVNVLEASRAANVKRFIYAASSSCYGIPKLYPTRETAPAAPKYPYALTKYIGELYSLHWGKVYKLPVLSLRLFNVYGPRSRTTGAYGAVFGVFLAQKLNQQPFTVVGNGTQERDFIFVTDMVQAFMLAAGSSLTNEILNVGSGQSYSVNRLVELLGGEAIHIPKRPGEPDRTQADISKIRKLLGWGPRVTFENGVAILLKNIDYWKSSPLWTPAKIAGATKEWFEYLCI